MKSSAASEAYLELLKESLLGRIYIENEAKLIQAFSMILHKEGLDLKPFEDNHNFIDLVNKLRDIKEHGHTLVIQEKLEDGSLIRRDDLRNIIELSHTMIGAKRLDNIRFCVETILREQIQGDFIETGIWRGGACIFMRGILRAYEIKDRTVWAADSFDGVPPPRLPQDSKLDLSKSVLPVLAVSFDDVKELFDRYGLLDSQVRFLQGWFKDTLGDNSISKLALLRLDGDLYESTIDSLNHLYKKVVPGGFVIVDDYGSCDPCKEAITDFRALNGIADPLVYVDRHCVYWRKE